MPCEHQDETVTTIVVYRKAKTIDELVNHTVGRGLDLFGIEHDLLKR